MKGFLMIIGFWAAAGSAADRSMFKAPHDETHPEVMAFYQRLCQAWADEQLLKGEARPAYLARCLAHMAATHPVGYERDEPENGHCH